jgi:hypothetical protein
MVYCFKAAAVAMTSLQDHIIAIFKKQGDWQEFGN